MCGSCCCNPCICGFWSGGRYSPLIGGPTTTYQWAPLSEKDIARIAEKVVFAISAERRELEELRAFKAGILALVGMK